MVCHLEGDVIELANAPGPTAPCEMQCPHMGCESMQGFFGCKHFSKANALLAKAGMPQIDWQIPPS